MPFFDPIYHVIVCSESIMTLSQCLLKFSMNFINAEFFSSTVDLEPIRNESRKAKSVFRVLCEMLTTCVNYYTYRHKAGGSLYSPPALPRCARESSAWLHRAAWGVESQVRSPPGHWWVSFSVEKWSESRVGWNRLSDLTVASGRFIRPEDEQKSSFPILRGLGTDIFRAMEWK